MTLLQPLIILALVVTAAGASPETSPVLPGIVPAVQSWNPSGGTWDIRGATVQATAREKIVAGQLNADLKRFPVTGAAATGTIHLTEVGADADRPEGYTMEIGDDVIIRSASDAGLRNGTRTLLQLACTNPLMPKGIISDWPDYNHRMLMLDVGRKPFPLPVLKDYIRMISWYKMNELHLHFSDEAFGGSYAAFRIRSDVFPELAAKDFSYSKQDIRELQDFANTCGVTITPEFDMPGHARCFTDCWPDTMLKGYPNYVDVTNPKTIENLKKLLDEMIPLFDGPDIHIGTDEYRVGDRPDLHEAFRQFINTMNAHIRSKGKNCRIWSGFEHMKGSTRIDPTVIIDMWETDDAKGQIALGHSIINSNHGRTYIVPGCKYYGISRSDIYQNWEPWMVSGDKDKNPPMGDPKLLGGKLNVWCDQGPTGYTQQEIADLTLPGIQAFAEKLWGTKGSASYGDFTGRAALTMPIPGVSVLDRLPATAPGGVVLEIPGEQVLAAADAVIPLPLSKAERGDLEYPWTLSLEVFPTAATETRGVLLSSDLAEICAGSSSGEKKEIVTEFADGTKRSGSIDTTGIGTVRAAGARVGKDPFSTYLAHDVSKFSGRKLELNRWTHISIVGSEGRNTIYIDGEKAFESGNQMLCPLRQLGSPTGNSFIGKLRGIKVVNRALTPKEIGRSAGLDIPDNLAVHAKATATSSDSAHGFTPENLSDEVPATRWSSGVTSADQSVTLDLQQPVTFNTVTIDWETAVPATYQIRVSDDGNQWKDVFTGEAAPGRTVATFPTTKARKVRVAMSRPKTGWGFSIFEIEIMNARAKGSKPASTH